MTSAGLPEVLPASLCLFYYFLNIWTVTAPHHVFNRSTIVTDCSISHSENHADCQCGCCCLQSVAGQSSSWCASWAWLQCMSGRPQIVLLLFLEDRRDVCTSPVWWNDTSCTDLQALQVMSLNSTYFGCSSIDWQEKGSMGKSWSMELTYLFPVCF